MEKIRKEGLEITTRDPGVMNNVFLCGCFNREGDYLIEWVEYHLQLGFGHIYLYDNNPNTVDMEQITFIQNHYGLRVTFINRRDQEYKQAQWYTEFYKTLRPDQWCLFIDIDEFLTFGQNTTLQWYISEAERRGCQHVKPNWMVYGNCGQITRTEGRVVDRFPIPASFELWDSIFLVLENSHVKAFLRGGLEGEFKNMHYMLSPNARGCDGDLIEHEANTPYVATPRFTKCWLRHYLTKSEQEWRENKMVSWPNGNQHQWMRYNKVNEKWPNVPCTKC